MRYNHTSCYLVILDNWIAGLSCNATLVVPVFGHHDVSIHAPAHTPAVTLHHEMCPIRDTIIVIIPTCFSQASNFHLPQFHNPRPARHGPVEWSCSQAHCKYHLGTTKPNICVHAIKYRVHQQEMDTWNDEWLASMATEIGPIDWAALCRDVSDPCSTSL